MPTLFDTLRDRWGVLQDEVQSVQRAIADAGGISSPEQDQALDDLQRQLDELAPRVERQSSLETRINATSQLLARAPTPAARPANDDVLYRDAGSYLVDFLAARQGDRHAADRLSAYMMRAAQNQTTVDNPGIVPDPIVGAVLDFVDATRPLVDSFGVASLPAYPTFYRPHVTQHSQVGKQTGEKVEIASRKMLIERISITAETYGGYVDLSLQDRDFTNPAIMGILVNDLAGQYAIQTESDASVELNVRVTQTGTAAGSTADDVLAAIFSAASTVYANASVMPNAVWASPDVWALVAPAWYGRPGNPGGTSAAGTFDSTVAGLRMVVSPKLPPTTLIVGSTRGAEAYEQRVGMLQMLEVSLLGMQVGYAGYFSFTVVNPQAFVKISIPAGP